MVADPRIGADALPHVLDVGAERIGEIGQFVHERDARREHRVGRVLGQLGRADVHHQQALAVALKRRVDGAQQRDRTLVVGADDDAVRSHEVLDGGAFLQKLRIGDDSERQSSFPRAASSAAIVSRTRSAVPTGTVDLSTMTL